jgi:hypothetical protein
VITNVTIKEVVVPVPVSKQEEAEESDESEEEEPDQAPA